MNTSELLIKNFLNSLNNEFPSKYLNKNIDFIRGLYKGILNLNDEQYQKIKHYSVIHNNLIELIYFCLFNLGFNFRINNKNKIIVNTKQENSKYIIAKLKNKKSITKKYINTFDLEIDSECHSFIANNSIVHNSACLTRTQTGIGVPQLSAIDECSRKAHDFNSYIIGDGGITCAGDIAKGLGAGSDFIMIGGLFGGHDENPGEIIEENNKKYKIFYGMSSKISMEKNYGKINNYRSSEGRNCKIPYKGNIENTVLDLLGGLRSTCTYIGASNIKELPDKCNFIRVNNQLNKIYEKFDN